jgi:hypothetical protein
MRAFNEFIGAPAELWPFVKFISESLGYTKKRAGEVNAYAVKDIKELCCSKGINAPEQMIVDASNYSFMRADLLNNYIQNQLMNDAEARTEFQHWYQIHKMDAYQCKLPLNKQTGEMKQIAYFTAIINIITEKTIREITGRSSELGFDDAPKNLTYFLGLDNRIIGASSRRFDGAYPSTLSPLLVWEIKEYYYTTTFGSRIADGVYETQLDGYEFKDMLERTGRKVYHVLFIDAYKTWWIQGKSYLCRLVDAINTGIVDEVIVGREVLTRWPELLREIVRP